MANKLPRYKRTKEIVFKLSLAFKIESKRKYDKIDTCYTEIQQ